MSVICKNMFQHQPDVPFIGSVTTGAAERGSKGRRWGQRRCDGWVGELQAEQRRTPSNPAEPSLNALY